MELLILLALPLMMLGGFTLDAATNDDDEDRDADGPSVDEEPII